MSRPDQERYGFGPEPDDGPRVHDWLDSIVSPLPARVRDEVVVQSAVIPQHGHWPWQRRRPERPLARPFSLAPAAVGLSAIALALIGLGWLLAPPETPTSDAGFVPFASEAPSSSPTAEPSDGSRTNGSAELIVAADGDGDYGSIGAALAHARAGDLIRVRPGEYEESLVVDKDVTIVGDGRPDEVVIRPPGATTYTPGAERPWHQPMATYRAAVLVISPAASISDLTLRLPTEDSGSATSPAGPGVMVIGGSPLLERLIVQGDGDHAATIVFTGGTEATLLDSTVRSSVYVGQASSPRLRGNDLRGGLLIVGADTRPVVEGNTVRGREAVVVVQGGAEPVIAGNDVAAGSSDPTVADGLIISEAGAEVLDNTFHHSRTGIFVDGGWPTISGNTIRDHATGLRVSCGQPVVMAVDNRIEANGVGLEILADCSGIDLSGDAWSTAIHANEICDNGVDVQASAESALLAANFVCVQSRVTDDAALRPLLETPWERRRVQWLDRFPADTDEMGRGGDDGRR